MAITYKKLFKLLLDRHLMKKDLIEMAGISSSSVTKLAKDETVQSDVLAKVCLALNVSLGDISEVYDENAPVEDKRKRAWLFMRSSVENGKEFQLESQVDKLNKYCQKQEYNIVGSSPVVGDYDAAEKEMQRLFNLAPEERGFEVVVMATSNRLSRDNERLKEWNKRWSSVDVEFETADYSLQTILEENNHIGTSLEEQKRQAAELVKQSGYILLESEVFGADKDALTIEDLRTLCLLNDFQPEEIGEHILKILVKSGK